MKKPAPLQDWAMQHGLVNSDSQSRDAFWDQIAFVRDKLPGIVYRVYDNDFEVAQQVEDTLVVVSTHMSKSLLLPVYRMVLPDGTLCTMRYNFYNWKVSVKAALPVTADFAGLFDPKKEIEACYCEGFRREWVFGSFSKNPQEFTVELGNKYEMYTFFWFLISNLAAQQKAEAA